MKRIPISRAIFFFLFPLLLPAGLALGDIGGPYGDYYMAYSGGETLTLLVRPDGGGRTLDDSFLPWGDTADATITLELRNANWDPVPNFPREDLWLVSLDGGLVPCVGGTIADADTDADGMTRWQNPIFGGGYSEAVTEVRVNGAPIEMTSGVHLSFNSPDIDGNLVVNLTDVAMFAGDYFGDYNFRSDLHRDGIINLHDLATISLAYGAACP